MHPTEEKSGGGRCCGMEALNGLGSPLCPQEQTSSAQPVRSEKCQQPTSTGVGIPSDPTYNSV